MLIQIKLSKVWGCKPSEVLKQPSDVVLAALEYEKFLNDYEAMAIYLARQATQK